MSLTSTPPLRVDRQAALAGGIARPIGHAAGTPVAVTPVQMALRPRSPAGAARIISHPVRRAFGLMRLDRAKVRPHLTTGPAALLLRMRHAHRMLRGRRLWLLGVGLLVAMAVLGTAGWMFVDDVLDFDCDGPAEYMSGMGGSCATPFAAAELAAGQASMTAHAGADTTGYVVIEYWYTNHTGEWRSIDSSKVTVLDAGGRSVECWWDDSAVMLPSSPRSLNARPCTKVPDDQHGAFRLIYDGATVDTIELP